MMETREKTEEIEEVARDKTVANPVERKERGTITTMRTEMENKDRVKEKMVKKEKMDKENRTENKDKIRMDKSKEKRTINKAIKENNKGNKIIPTGRENKIQVK